MKKMKAPSEAASQAMELGILLGRRALIPENAEKAAEAVTHLRAEAEPKTAAPRNVTAQLAALERRGRQVANAFADMAGSDLAAEHREALLQTVQAVRLELLRVEIGIR